MPKSDKDKELEKAGEGKSEGELAAAAAAEEAEKVRLEEEQKAEEHKERSELGRKVKGIESRLDTELFAVNDKLDQLLAKDVEDIEEEGDDEIPQSKKELDEYMEKKFQARERASKDTDTKYNTDYQTAIGQFSEEEDYGEICKELEANFNIRKSDNGDVDGQLNYLKASKSFYKKKASGKDDKPNPLKGKGNDLPLGTPPGGDEEIDKEEAMPKLDAYAQDYMKKTGMSEESVKKAMKGELPLGMQGIA